MLSVLTVALLLPAVIAAITGDTAGMHNIVLDKTTGDVYIDWNGNHQLLTAEPDMQITLVGVNRLTGVSAGSILA